MTVHVHGYGQGNSVKSGGVKLILCAKAKLLNFFTPTKYKLYENL